MNTSVYTKSLPLLASALGRQYGVKVEIGGKEAFTDGRTIHVPALPEELTPEQLSLSRAFIDHESGHCRFTNIGDSRLRSLNDLEKHLWNILEDYRVEMLMGRLYPGCAANLRALARTKFPTEPIPKGTQFENVVLSWILRTARSWLDPEISTLYQEQAIRRQSPGLLAKLVQAMDGLKPKLKSSEDCLNAAYDLERLLMDWLKNQKKQSKPEQGKPQGKSGGDSKNQSQDESGESGQGQSNDQPQRKSQNQSQSQPESGESASSAETSTQNTNTPDKAHARAVRAIDRLLTGESKNLPQDFSRMMAESLQEISGDTPGRDSVTVATVVTPAMTHLNAGESLVSDALTQGLRLKLAGFLQSQVLQPAIPARRGRLNPTALHRIPCGNPRAFLRDGERQGLDTHLHILVDASSSMSGSPFRTAISCSYAIALAMQNVRGTSTAVSMFPGNRGTTVAELVKPGGRPDLSLLPIPGGYTPLGESVWYVLQQMQTRPEHRKILVVMTDGLPDSAYQAEQALNALRRTGVEVFGIGISADDNFNLFPDGTFRRINNESGLPEALFGLLSSTLTIRR